MLKRCMSIMGLLILWCSPSTLMAQDPQPTELPPTTFDIEVTPRPQAPQSPPETQASRATARPEVTEQAPARPARYFRPGQRAGMAALATGIGVLGGLGTTVLGLGIGGAATANADGAEPYLLATTAVVTLGSGAFLAALTVHELGARFGGKATLKQALAGPLIATPLTYAVLTPLVAWRLRERGAGRGVELIGLASLYTIPAALLTTGIAATRSYRRYNRIEMQRRPRWQGFTFAPTHGGLYSGVGWTF